MKQVVKQVIQFSHRQQKPRDFSTAAVLLMWVRVEGKGLPTGALSTLCSVVGRRIHILGAWP